MFISSCDKFALLLLNISYCCSSQCMISHVSISSQQIMMHEQMAGLFTMTLPSRIIMIMILCPLKDVHLVKHGTSWKTNDIMITITKIANCHRQTTCVND